MKKKRAIFWIAAMVLMVGWPVYRFFTGPSTQEKILALLGSHRRVWIKNRTEPINSRELLEKYYRIFGYSDTWTTTEPSHISYRDRLNEMLHQADSLGLNRADYHADFVAAYDSMAALPDFDVAHFKTESEVIFADAALSFLFDVAYGKDLKTSYNGVAYAVDTARILQAYHAIVQSGAWRTVLDTLEPHRPQYVLLKQQLNRMQAFLRNFPEVDTLSVSDSPAGQIAAALKLRCLGLISDSMAMPAGGMDELPRAIVAFQQMMNSDSTGKLDKRTLALFNESLRSKVTLLQESLNFWRWTSRLAELEFVLVNIPAASLQLVKLNTADELTMRVILGKDETPTPLFTAYISKVIAYPYWNVPFSIATKEMLPKIKRSISYLEANNLQVLNSKGELVNPHAVTWASLSSRYFPYRLRQSTGCDNALGVLKFDLQSPFSIYLHDTNARNLFARANRFLSHGCIRIEKPMELANYILADGLDSATTAKLNQCLKEEKPTEFKLRKNFPVLILYLRADVDANGHLKFYRDVYGKAVKKTV